MTALYCPTPEDLGRPDEPAGCGTVWTPDHDTKPRLPHACTWAWCPDCKLPVPEE